MMNSSREVGVAVDGGGTKTTTVVHDLVSGAILGRASTSATNPHSVGDEQAFSALSSGFLTALTAANRATQDVVAVTLGMSGCDRPDDKIKMADWVSKILSKPSTSVDLAIHNDGTIALSCGTKGKLAGVVVISGTGTIALGYHGDQFHRAAGWGPLLGDIGCGYWLGEQALRAVTFASDGRGPATCLVKKVLDQLHLDDATGLIGWAYGDKTQAMCWGRVAELAPLVAQSAATERDAVSLEILDKAADGLVDSISAVASKIGYDGVLEPFTVVYAGGLLSNGVLDKRVSERLTKKFPKVVTVSPDVEPVMGAVFLTLDRLQNKSKH